MRREILINSKTIQLINKIKSKNLFKRYLANKKFPKLSLMSSNYNHTNTTKYVPVCAVQGKYQKCLKIFQFNRHLIRNATAKQQFSNLKLTSW